ncbi:helix-turn-helix transcriptional regulator [PVC group bacterium]|nr:helix-turn-helix transcriptional regulator [PVC group bacterium]
MSNTKRLMIMDFLSRMGEACVGSIAEEIEATISSTSQHLRLMRDNNVVVSRKDGHTVFYRLKHPKIMDGCSIVREVLMDELKNSSKMAGVIGNQV